MIRSHLLDAYADTLLHGFTTREEGNLAFHVDDDPATVHANQQRLAALMGYDREALVHMKQVHSDTLCDADPALSYDRPPTCDAVMTATPNRPLMVMVADCIPLLLFDPLRRVIAAVHAGRAGAFDNIAGKSIAGMHTEHGCDPADILAVLGPSIRMCCYEVGEAIDAEARERGFAKAMHVRDGRHYLDVQGIVKTQLYEAGVIPEHLEAMAHCTACENDRFYSYRADAQSTGRFAGVVMLKRP